MERGIFTRVSQLITNGQFSEAEEVLLIVRSRAAESRDGETYRSALIELIDLYCIMEPPKLAAAEELCLERERIDRSAQSELQTAMFLYHSVRNPYRASDKLRDAILTGRRENDFPTVYSALALLGVASLDIGRIEDARSVLIELERLVREKKPIRPGDETRFLERAAQMGVDAERVITLARCLAAICRDPAFRDRLTQLSDNESGKSTQYGRVANP